MKNVIPNQLKKCIFLTLDEFRDVIHEALSPDITVEYTFDGLDIHNNIDYIDYEDLCGSLAEYFDVKEVTSVHADDCDHPCVWIVYKNESEEGK